jgi:L-ascorbate metabolism protein UlaG (beta-lactamase superfamily)
MTDEQPSDPTSATTPRWRVILRRGAIAMFTSFLLFVALVIIDGWTAMGTSATGERLERMQASAQWDGSGFENPQPIINGSLKSLSRMFDGSDYASPDPALVIPHADPTVFDTPPATGLRVTWLGHSTVLVEIDGLRILTDPVWGEVPMPVTWLGPKRWYPPPLRLDELPPIDLVVISHDHYDHLDEPTMRAIRDWDAAFVAPLGVGAHLAYWGIPEEKITELDWWESRELEGVEVTCTPARHASGRHVLDQNATLWAGYAFVGDEHRVFFSGDTGLFPGMNDIGEKLGPFDLTMIEVGAYDMGWPDWHIGPEQAVRAHGMLGGKLLLPVHWGLFDLALHGWTEPIERVIVEGRAKGAQLATPRPGQSFEPEALPSFERWWPDVPWQGPDVHPVVSSQVD